jgi:enolase-phosphatase E1
VTAHPPRAVLTDIEGTTTPIAFVHRTLFPFARARLGMYLEEHPEDDAVMAALAEVHRLAPDALPLHTLLDWIDRDAKVAPLKTLQGLVWGEGYASGALRSEIYDDVAPALRRWHAGGIRLAVYSSGSVAAQKLLFGYTEHGDLNPLFDAYFDTATGAKRDSASYAAIAHALALPLNQILFLSDVEAELDAAAASGLGTCQILRPADGTAPSARHPKAVDFDMVSYKFGLPAA